MIRLPDRLAVLLSGRLVGQVERDGSKLKFVYDEEWLGQGPGIPLSLSMPMTAAEHKGDAISNWMWGVLPDNEAVLKAIGREYDVSYKNPFALLWVIGQDCAGAVQFIEPDRIGDLIDGGEIQWLDREEIGRRLARLRQDASTGRRKNEGQFSLAGAQPKTALAFEDGKWGIPSGRIPTTHILKPPSAGFKAHAENEHFCLSLAHEVGIVAAESTVEHFGDEIAIVIKRYDRLPGRDGQILRIHQEDMVQAMGIHPDGKYEVDGGPGIRRLMDKLHASTSPVEDRRRFMEAVVFNFLIGGTDAHAKNYSILFGPRQIRLAPLYDVASYLPYAERWADVRMPMKIDKYYLYTDVFPRHWERVARSVGFPVDDLLGMVRDLSEKIPAAASVIGQRMAAKGLMNAPMDRLVDLLIDWCRSVHRQFDQPVPILPK
jgi:serine/threonine-protein kinase HipA